MAPFPAERPFDWGRSVPPELFLIGVRDHDPHGSPSCEIEFSVGKLLKLIKLRIRELAEVEIAREEIMVPEFNLEPLDPVFIHPHKFGSFKGCDDEEHGGMEK